MQKIKIGHRANFRAKYKCFPQVLFPVDAILRIINFRCTDFNTALADACTLVMACVDCVRACTYKPFRASLRLLKRECYLLFFVNLDPENEIFISVIYDTTFFPLVPETPSITLNTRHLHCVILFSNNYICLHFEMLVITLTV